MSLKDYFSLGKTVKIREKCALKKCKKEFFFHSLTGKHEVSENNSIVGPGLDGALVLHLMLCY